MRPSCCWVCICQTQLLYMKFVWPSFGSTCSGRRDAQSLAVLVSTDLVQVKETQDLSGSQGCWVLLVCNWMRYHMAILENASQSGVRRGPMPFLSKPQLMPLLNLEISSNYTQDLPRTDFASCDWSPTSTSVAPSLRPACVARGPFSGGTHFALDPNHSR